jgi:hypothetical protein
MVTGFAAPSLFRLALLRLGYHWKDPGAGPVHGDMTHRLQWYAICSAQSSIGLRVSPLYLFQKLASPETWNEQASFDGGGHVGGRALWDFICDCFLDPLQKDPSGVGPYCDAASYRSPVSLQRDLTTKEYLPAVQRLPLLRRIMARKKARIQTKIDNLANRHPLVTLEYFGLKEEAMNGDVAFYLKRTV